MTHIYILESFTMQKISYSDQIQKMTKSILQRSIKMYFEINPVQIFSFDRFWAEFERSNIRFILCVLGNKPARSLGLLNS